MGLKTSKVTGYSRRYGFGAALLFGGLALGGCAPMSVAQPVVTDVPKSVEQRPIPTEGRSIEVEAQEPEATLRVERLCNVTQYNHIERTTERKYHNDAPQNDVWAGIGGLLIAGTGVALVVDPTIGMKDGEESKLSPKEMRGVGVGLIGVGAALLAVPLIDHIRESRTAEHRVERVAEPGPILRQDERCGPVDPGTKVSARFPDGHDVLLGATDETGRVRIDLDKIVGSEWLFQANDSADVHLTGSPIGRAQLSLKHLYARREDAAWARVMSSECPSSIADGACAAEIEYAARFRATAHFNDAKQRVEGWNARRQAAAEASAWDGLDLTACRSPKKRTSVEVEQVCQPLEAFVRAYPNSNHALDVVGALNAGRAARDVLARNEARQEEAAEAARASAYAPSYATPSGNVGGFIPYAGNGGGPTLCADGQWSHSSGRGTCSHHGGVSGGGSSRSHSGGHSSGGRRSGGGGKRR